VVVAELIPDLLTLGEVQRILANLLREKVSIRDMPTILEALADGARGTRDIDLLTEQVRQHLGRHITEPLIKQGFLHAVVLSPAIEQQMKESLEQTDHGTYLNLDPLIAQRVVNALNRQLANLPQGVPRVVISSPYVRMYFKRLTDRLFRDLTVLSYAEIYSDVGIKTVGVVEL
ncbi:MAG TPA: EscV/YscV/HrcV family type III secretion system export apparatus protein, partial [Sulfobacillus sp.]|nr:EscV/YscV/HrcV family type III secretion system export apparatus protein [Sulfobacillus sp.]